MLGPRTHIELEDAALLEPPPGQREDQPEAGRRALARVARLERQVTARQRRRRLLRRLTGARGLSCRSAVAAAGAAVCAERRCRLGVRSDDESHAKALPRREQLGAYPRRGNSAEDHCTGEEAVRRRWRQDGFAAQGRGEKRMTACNICHDEDSGWGRRCAMCSEWQSSPVCTHGDPRTAQRCVASVHRWRAGPLVIKMAAIIIHKVSDDVDAGNDAGSQQCVSAYDAVAAADRALQIVSLLKYLLTSRRLRGCRSTAHGHRSGARYCCGLAPLMTQ